MSEDAASFGVCEFPAPGSIVSITNSIHVQAFGKRGRVIGSEVILDGLGTLQVKVVVAWMANDGLTTEKMSRWDLALIEGKMITCRMA